MRNIRKRFGIQRHGDRGFSTVELLIVISISFIMAALAIPGYNTIRRTLRITGDVRDLNGAINQAKLEGASSFTQARLYADLGANTFHIETWNKTGGGGGGGCWKTVNDPANPCTAATSPVQNLSPGVTFGFSGVGNPPPNTQPTLSQARKCRALAAGTGSAVTPNTACVLFNSRGIPVDPVNAAPTGIGALYITDNNMVYGLTVGATGVTQLWAASANGTGGWYHQ
jgi:Tfp pilus assembly protein FimT